MLNRIKGTLCVATALLAVLGVGTAAPAGAQAPPPQADVANRRVTLNLENADLRYALKLLFTSAGVNYALDQSVQGTVTVSLTDVPFRTALESVLRSTQSIAPLTYRVEDNVYNIALKVEAPPLDPGAGLGTDTEAPRARSSITKIYLNFADVFDIANAFGGTVIESRASQMGGGGGMGGFGGGGMGGFGGGGMGGFGGGGMGGGFRALVP